MKKLKDWNWWKIGAWTLASAVVGSALVYFNFIVETPPEPENNPGADGGVNELNFTLDTLYKIEDGKFVIDTEKTWSISDYKGQVVVLNFWAVWCQPCKVEIPHFNEFYEEYKDEGVEVVVISTDVSMTAQQLADKELNNPSDKDYQQYYHTWNTFNCSFGKYNMDNDVLKLFDNSGSLPVTVVIDREGNVAHVQASDMSYEELEELVVPYL